MLLLLLLCLLLCLCEKLCRNNPMKFDENFSEDQLGTIDKILHGSGLNYGLGEVLFFFF